MPVVQLVGARIWRFPLLEGANDGLLVDVLPSIAGADGQAVHWDATLDGNLFASGPHVTRNPWVTEFEAGAAIVWHGMRLSYTHVFQTQEFRGQRGGLFQFGSFTAAARF